MRTLLFSLSAVLLLAAAAQAQNVDDCLGTWESKAQGRVRIFKDGGYYMLQCASPSGQTKLFFPLVPRDTMLAAFRGASGPGGEERIVAVPDAKNPREMLLIMAGGVLGKVSEEALRQEALTPKQQEERTPEQKARTPSQIGIPRAP